MREKIICDAHGEPVMSACICDIVAAAEERGRRRGVEERDGLRALLREALGVIPRNNPMYLSLRGRIDAALAPRDSGPDSILPRGPNP